MTPTETGTRPRVEGERELEIFEATLDVLDEVGYDLLTMDAVASRAKASKATLYRRWKGKPESVVAAIMADKGEPVVPDTGTPRGDLLEAYCGGDGGLNDPLAQSVLSAVVIAMERDPEFAEVYRRDSIGPRSSRRAPSTSVPASVARCTPTWTCPTSTRARRHRPAPRVPPRRHGDARARRSRADEVYLLAALHGPCS